MTEKINFKRGFPENNIEFNKIRKTKAEDVAQQVFSMNDWDSLFVDAPKETIEKPQTKLTAGAERNKEAPHAFTETTAISLSQNLPHFTEEEQKNFYYYGSYELNHTIRDCIRQPNTEKSCGAGATLMLLATMKKINPHLTIDPSFWTWYLTASKVTKDEIENSLEKHTNLFKLGYSLEILNIDLPNTESEALKIEYNQRYENYPTFLLNSLKEKLAIAASPLITDITHPMIENHWIIVDEITETHVKIRDPYKGLAYEITHAEYAESTKITKENGCPALCLYLTKKTNH